jgi:hypothetical protein
VRELGQSPVVWHTLCLLFLDCQLTRFSRVCAISVWGVCPCLCVAVSAAWSDRANSYQSQQQDGGRERVTSRCTW